MTALDELLRSSLDGEAGAVDASWNDRTASTVSTRAGGVARRLRRRRRLTGAGAAVALVTTTIVGTIVGTIRLGSQGQGEPPTGLTVTGSSPVTPYVPAYLPPGFTLRNAEQADDSVIVQQREWYRVYRAVGEPIGAPTLLLSWVATNAQTAGARSGLYGSGLERSVERDGFVVSVRGRGVDEAQVSAAASSIARDGAGYLLGSLPDGWHEAARIDDRPAMPTGHVTLRYLTSAGKGGPVFEIGVSAQPTGLLEMTGATEPVVETTLRGRRAIVGGCQRVNRCDAATGSSSLLWEEENDTTISISSENVSDDEMRKVAESLRPVDLEAWHALTAPLPTSPTVPVPASIAAPTFALSAPPAGWSFDRADSGRRPGKATGVQRAAYRTGAGALDPYVLVITADADSNAYGFRPPGSLQTRGDYRTFGVSENGRSLEVHTWRVPEREVVALVEQLRRNGLRTPLPDKLGTWRRTATDDGMTPGRYDSISYTGDAGSFEIHNSTGDFTIALDERLSEDGRAAELVTIDGRVAARVDVDDARTWVLLPDAVGTVEIDYQGPAGQLDGLLAGASALSPDDYRQLLAHR